MYLLSAEEVFTMVNEERWGAPLWQFHSSLVPVSQSTEHQSVIVSCECIRSDLGLVKQRPHAYRSLQSYYTSNKPTV